MSKALEMATEVADLGRQFREAGKARFNEFVETIFADFSTVNRIVIRGSTPAFNDGDPCTHSHFVALTTYDFVDEIYDGLPELEGGESCGDYEGNDFKFKPGVDPRIFNVDISEEDEKTLRTAFEAFDDTIESLFNTNFTLTWKRGEDGAITFENEEYYCDY